MSLKIKKLLNYVSILLGEYQKVQEWWKILCSKLRGHYQYYGVEGNAKYIKRFYYHTTKIVFKWLNKRSQKKSYNWEKFNIYLKQHPLPLPKVIVYLYNN